MQELMQPKKKKNATRTQVKVLIRAAKKAATEAARAKRAADARDRRQRKATATAAKSQAPQKPKQKEQKTQKKKTPKSNLCMRQRVRMNCGVCEMAETIVEESASCGLLAAAS